MPVTAPADRRFLRARVKPGRRPSAWRIRFRRLRRLSAATIGVAAVAIVVRAALASGAFQISRLVVRGTVRLAAGEVLSLMDGLRGQNIFVANLDTWRTRLLESAWVRDATLRRVLPATIEITVTERQPMGIGRIGTELYLVDDRGEVIDEFGPRYVEFDLPVIDGLERTLTGPDAVTGRRRASLAARLLAAVRTRPDLARRISQIDVSDPHDAVVVLDHESVRLRLGEGQFAERLQSYLELGPTLRERVPEMAYVDLRFGERVYVGTAGIAHAEAAPAGRKPEP